MLQDSCHKLAWTLDACLNARSLDSRRLRELQHFFAPHDTAGAMAPPRPTGASKRSKHRHGADNDAESQGKDCILSLSASILWSRELTGGS